MESKDANEMRLARLKRFGQSDAKSDNNSDKMDYKMDSKDSDKMDYKMDSKDSKDSKDDGIIIRKFNEYEIATIKRVAYEGGGATAEDMARWYEQGFTFCNNLSFGLQQSQGGPCGILAAVQAEMIRYLIDSDNQDVPILSTIEAQTLLIHAILNILYRALPPNKKCITLCIFGTYDYNISTFDFMYNDINVYEIDGKNDAYNFIMDTMLLQLQSNYGCYLILLSLLLTRGADVISDDMDMSSNTLIGSFGHCSQDLINLLLTGKATSNVMDGNVSLGDDTGIVLKGVSDKSTIGYLTLLEAMRLCQVGNNYKVPEYPIWVIGSESHFTVLFSFDVNINAESNIEKLLANTEKAFKLYDKNDCGLIDANDLKEVLATLNLPQIDDIINDAFSLARLRGHLQMDGGIILWSVFWENISQLIDGSATVDTLIKPPVLSTAMITTDTASTRPRSDSDIARELQAQFNNESNGNTSTQTNSMQPFTSSQLCHETSNNNNNNSNSNRPRSDSDIARELQAQFNNEDDIPPLVNMDLFGGEAKMDTSMSVTPVITPTAAAAPPPTSTTSNEVRFTLYHFNGFKPATLTKLVLKNNITGSLIGKAMSMTTTYSSNGWGNALEDIIKTRWPSCTIDWLTNPTPQIN